jgi:phage gp36-like protein
LGYITKEDLRKEIGEGKLLQLADPNGTGAVDDEYVGKAIAYAEGKFDSYVLSRYSSPIPVTEIVKSTCLVLAIYKLYANNLTIEEGKYKIEKDLHDSAIKWLEAVARGTAILPGAVLIGVEAADGSDDISLPGTISLPVRLGW